MAPADMSGSAGREQSIDPDGGVGVENVDALIRGLGVAAGDKLDGRYRLDTVLHTTGSAVTWLATDEKLNRPSRIHLLRSDQPRAEAFMAAARAAAAMPDNHFVQVLDAVPDEGVYYVITEWLHDGHTLGEILAKGPVPVAETVRITTELARAMAEAHDNGLAHLRLSPKTVLRTDTGEVKILDLCLAAALTGTVSRDPLGTDLTAIGELAYALLTGKRPQANPVPPSELRPDVTPQLDEVVLRILGDPSAGEPYQTPTDVAEALSQLPRPRYEHPLPSTPQTAPLRHAQTTVMPVNNRATAPQPQLQQSAAQGYPPAPTRSETRPGASHGGGHRAAAYDDDGYGGHSGGSRTDTKNLKIGGGIAAALVLALVAYLIFSPGSDTKGKASASTGGTTPSTSQSSDTPSSTPGAGLAIAKAMAYTSKPGEPDDPNVTKAYDNNPSTAWNTASYQEPKIFRQGSGIVFDLGQPQTVKSVDITVTSPGATVQMFAAADSVTALPAVKDGSKGNSVPDGFTQVKSQDVTTASFTFTPDAPMKTRFVLVWFTVVPKAPAGSTCGGPATCYGDGLAEVKFNGP